MVFTSLNTPCLRNRAVSVSSGSCAASAAGRRSEKTAPAMRGSMICFNGLFLDIRALASTAA
jgi:hypothetical protein